MSDEYSRFLDLLLTSLFGISATCILLGVIIGVHMKEIVAELKSVWEALKEWLKK